MINWYRNKGKGTIEETNNYFFYFFFPPNIYKKALILENRRPLCPCSPLGFVQFLVYYSMCHIGYSYSKVRTSVILLNVMKHKKLLLKL